MFLSPYFFVVSLNCPAHFFQKALYHATHLGPNASSSSSRLDAVFYSDAPDIAPTFRRPGNREAIIWDLISKAPS
jgi:hypothetical protein